jgi:hypothetical protein
MIATGIFQVGNLANESILSSEMESKQYPTSASSEEESDVAEPGFSREYMIERLVVGTMTRIDLCLKDKKFQGDVVELQTLLILHVDEIQKISDLVSYLKEHLTKYIVTDGIDLISCYDLIIGDGKFKEYVIPKHMKEQKLEQPELPPMAAEDLINMDSWVEKNCQWNTLKKLNSEDSKDQITKINKPLTKFNVGQIVGAKDQERKWWMARILFVFEDPKYPYPWYYVQFEGWEPIQNEWISSPSRIKKFNPRRDFLKR